MTHIVTLELPEEVAQSAQSVALRTQRKLEEILVEWIDNAVAELPVGHMSDEQILALCDLQLESGMQDELSELLAENQAGTLTPEQRVRLDELMQVYRRGLVRKAQALNEAVARGLRSPLN